MAPPASPFNDQHKKWIIYKFGLIQEFNHRGTIAEIKRGKKL